MVNLLTATPVPGSPRSLLGEGPVWDYSVRTLYWVDILEGKIHIYRPLSNEFSSIELGEIVSCVAPAGPRDLVATLKNRVVLIRDGKIYSTLAEIREPERNRFNDCKCDARGRLWAGTMDMEEKSPSGSLYVLESGKAIRRVLGGITISNGISWSLDNRLMYYIDSPKKRVEIYGYDIDGGDIVGLVDTIDLSSYNGIPDGMTIDSRGTLWIAIWGAGRVVNIDPRTKEVLNEVSVPAPFTSSCTFGGEDLRTLYITTASNRVKGLEEGVYDGFLYQVRLDITGIPINYFKL